MEGWLGESIMSLLLKQVPGRHGDQHIIEVRYTYNMAQDETAFQYMPQRIPDGGGVDQI